MKTNGLLVPIPNENGNKLLITFPTTEMTIQEWVDSVKNQEIVSKIGSSNDPFKFNLHMDAKAMSEHMVTETYLVKSFRTAVDHYSMITEGMSDKYD